MPHIGCGQVDFPGWVHLDANPGISHVTAVWQDEDGLPCDDSSCSFIYNEHFLEHLPVEKGVAFLRECRRALAPGGVLRVAMPDLTECVRHYWEHKWSEQPWLPKYGYGWIRTRAEYLNICFREWDHQWLYDREELHRRLGEAGFARIVDVPPSVSEHVELRSRETRAESVLVCEAL